MPNMHWKAIDFNYSSINAIIYIYLITRSD